MNRQIVMALWLAGCTEEQLPSAADASLVDAAVRELDAMPSLDAMTVDAASIDAEPVDAAPVAVDACASEPRLAPAVVEHACLHGRDGPFRVVDAVDVPDVSRSHTLFTVLTQPGVEAHVRYLPSGGGDHVVFLSRASLAAATQGERALAIEADSAACDVLPERYLLPLQAAEPVELVLRAESERIALVIEALANWGSEAWERACSAPAPDAGMCRKSGPCSSDDECCSYCHDYDHCH